MNDRVKPMSDELTAPFWDAAQQQRLVIQKCHSCKQFIHPPQALCLDCRSDQSLIYEPVSGLGTVYSYTTVRRSPTGSAVEPYVVVVVELAEQSGLFMITNLLDATEAEIGESVTVAWERIADNVTIPQFRRSV